MPALTRRRDPEARQECWQVFYGDVRAGWIGERAGVPYDEDGWGWACGFYPGSEPRECTSGAAATFKENRRKIQALARLRCARRSNRRSCIFT
jgi:hypothetical protein